MQTRRFGTKTSVSLIVVLSGVWFLVAYTMGTVPLLAAFGAGGVIAFVSIILVEVLNHIWRMRSAANSGRTKGDR